MKLWRAIAKSCQINWRVEIVENSAITEVNELKNIYITVFRFTFEIFQGFFKCKFFTFSTLNPSGTTRLILK